MKGESMAISGCICDPKIEGSDVVKPYLKIVYALTLGEDRLPELAMVLSVESLKVFHPELEVIGVTEKIARDQLSINGSPLLELVDTWVQCDDVSGTASQKSRAIKSSLRRRITGTYLFLDVDTVVVKELSLLRVLSADIAIVQDRYSRTIPAGFPDWVVPHYRALGWDYPTKQYFNTGVMLVQDNHRTHKLYAEWEKCLGLTLKQGIYQDQPAFNHALEKTRINAHELPMAYNAMVQTDELYRYNAHILHFFYNKTNYRCALSKFTSEYQTLIDRLEGGHAVAGGEIIQRMHARKALSGTLSWRRQYQAGNLPGAVELLTRRIFGALYG
jgi:hypothetical protein